MTSIVAGLKWALGRALVILFALLPVIWLFILDVTVPMNWPDRLNLTIGAGGLEYATLQGMNRLGLKQFITPPLSSSFNHKSRLVKSLAWLNQHRRLKSALSPFLFFAAVSPAAITILMVDYRFPFLTSSMEKIGMPFAMVTALTLIFALQFFTFNATHPRRVSSIQQMEVLLSLQNRELSSSSLERSSTKYFLRLTTSTNILLLAALLTSLALIEITAYGVFPNGISHLLTALAIGLYSGAFIVRRLARRKESRLQEILDDDYKKKTKTYPVLDNWACSYTNPTRYSYWGITEYVLEYAQTRGHRSLVVLDVGCSTGVAAHDMKLQLAAHGVSVRLVGIDVNPDVAALAKQNFDEFILGDMLKMDAVDVPKADVIICSFAVIFVEAQRRSQMIQKCSSLLKPEGRLITNADRFQRMSLTDEIRAEGFSLGLILSLRRGFSSFAKDYQLRRYQVRRRRIYVIDGQVGAEKYAVDIMTGWNRLDVIAKCLWLSNIFLSNTNERAIRQLRRIFRVRKSQP